VYLRPIDKLIHLSVEMVQGLLATVLVNIVHDLWPPRARFRTPGGSMIYPHPSPMVVISDARMASPSLLGAR
jgi:hypothetical protein